MLDCGVVAMLKRRATFSAILSIGRLASGAAATPIVIPAEGRGVAFVICKGHVLNPLRRLAFDTIIIP